MFNLFLLILYSRISNIKEENKIATQNEKLLAEIKRVFPNAFIGYRIPDITSTKPKGEILIEYLQAIKEPIFLLNPELEGIEAFKMLRHKLLNPRYSNIIPHRVYAINGLKRVAKRMGVELILERVSIPEPIVREWRKNLYILGWIVRIK